MIAKMAWFSDVSLNNLLKSQLYVSLQRIIGIFSLITTTQWIDYFLCA